MKTANLGINTVKMHHVVATMEFFRTMWRPICNENNNNIMTPSYVQSTIIIIYYIVPIK